MKCSICKTEITADPNGWEGGCNAQPINDGICCYKCDKEIVLPRRLADAGIDINNAKRVYWLGRLKCELPEFPINLIKER